MNELEVHGGRCTVGGAWWEVHGGRVGGGRCMVGGARWEVHGGRCTVGGAWWEVHGGRVGGGRCMVGGAWWEVHGGRCTHCTVGGAYLWCSPLDWNLSPMGNIVLTVLKIPGHSKVCNLYM